MATSFLIIHGVLAMFLVGAVTHQALGVFWPKSPGQTGFLANARGIRPQVYTNGIIWLYLLTFVMGAISYPTYRVFVRPPLQDLMLTYAIGLFEVKENFAAIVLAMLPAYWYFWSKYPDYTKTRAILTFIVVTTVWYNFIAGHVLNNLRGFG